jgi:hypothetical protein
MQEYPMAFEEFTSLFSTGEQCREYLIELRWPNGFRCPKQGKQWRDPDGNRYQGQQRLMKPVLEGLDTEENADGGTSENAGGRKSRRENAESIHS